MRLPVVMLLLCLGCGPRTLEARMRDAERTADKAQSRLDEAEAAMNALEPKDMARALDRAKDLLAEKDFELHPEASMHQERYQALVARLPGTRAAREKRDLEVRLNKARDTIVPRVQALLEAQDALQPLAPTAAACEAVERAAKSLREALEDDQELFQKDADFSAWARSQRLKADRAVEAATRGRRALAFLEGPLAAWSAGSALAAEARGLKSPPDRVATWERARARLADCRGSVKPFEDDKALAGLAFPAGQGKPQTPAQLAQACEKALKAVETDLQKARPASRAPRR